jgi:hypothetical protein
MTSEWSVKSIRNAVQSPEAVTTASGHIRYLDPNLIYDECDALWNAYVVFPTHLLWVLFPLCCANIFRPLKHNFKNFNFNSEDGDNNIFDKLVTTYKTARRYSPKYHSWYLDHLEKLSLITNLIWPLWVTFCTNFVMTVATSSHLSTPSHKKQHRDYRENQ